MNFWSKNLPNLIFSVETKERDCNITDNPPKPTMELAKIVFVFKLLHKFEILTRPRVISRDPDKTASTTEGLILLKHTQDIMLDKNDKTWQNFKMSIKTKLKQTKPAIIKIDNKESYTMSLKEKSLFLWIQGFMFKFSFLFLKINPLTRADKTFAIKMIIPAL